MALAAGPLGAVLAGYTGVLISNTAVPVWSAGRRIMPLLFLSSSGLSAAAMLEFMDLNRHEQRAMRRFGAIAAASELACSFALERETALVPQAAVPLRKGFSGFLWNTAKVLTAVSLGLFLWPKRTKGARRARAIVGTAAGLTLRFAVHYAGDASADDPKGSFHQQRAGKGAAEVTGKAAITGPDPRKKKAALADGLSFSRQSKQSVKK